MRVAVNAYVPEDCDFLDAGWDIMYVDVGPIERKFVVSAVNRALSATEVESFKLPDFAHPERTYGVDIFGWKRIL